MKINKKIFFLFTLCLLCQGCIKNEEEDKNESGSIVEFDENATKDVLMDTLDVSGGMHLSERTDAVIDVLQKAGVKGAVSAENVEQERFPISIQIESEDGRRYEIGMKENVSVEAIKDLETSKYIYAVTR